MKKIGIVSLTLVLALGVLGVGYAMWSDTVTIDGSVETGSVNLDIVEVSETYVYKVVQAFDAYSVGDMICSPTPMTLEQDDPPDGINNLLEVSSATTTINAGGAEPVDESVTMTFTNLFPTDPADCEIVADLVIHYTGSIPAHIATTGPTWTGDDLSAYIDFEWLYMEQGGASCTGGTWVPATLADIQLHDCDCLKLNVIVDGEQLQLDGVNAQSLYGEFDMTFTAHQWNETP
jgi:hypothetical protein